MGGHQLVGRQDAVLFGLAHFEFVVWFGSGVDQAVNQHVFFGGSFPGYELGKQWMCADHAMNQQVVLGGSFPGYELE